MTSVRQLRLFLGLCGSLWMLAGCGGSNSAPVAINEADQVAEDQESAIGLPTAAIPGLKPAANKSATSKSNAKPSEPVDAPKEVQRKPPEKGSPEWILEEIQRIKALPLPGSEEPTTSKPRPAKLLEKLNLSDKPDDDADGEMDDDDSEKPLTPEEEEKLKKQFEKSKEVRRERNLQVIKLAESCLVATAKKPDMEAYFDAAVHYLLDARMQLALQGDSGSVEALYDAAKAFYDRKPDSVAAVESELTLVNLTHAYALRYGQSQPKWLQEFAKHSQLYATRFPDEEHRSVALLAAAARSCEVAGLNAEATSCYSVLLTKFKDSPQAQQAAGVIRRLQLPGKTLELSGPTMEGEDWNIDAHRGKMVVVIYWATHARPFVEQLPKLQATLKKYEKYATPVGVNLDADPNAVEAFLEKSGITWPQIFSPNRALRGWNSPLAVHYGINNLPTIWLVDPNGVVVDTNINAETLASRMYEVYLPFLKAASGKTEPAVPGKLR